MGELHSQGLRTEHPAPPAACRFGQSVVRQARLPDLPASQPQPRERATAMLQHAPNHRPENAGRNAALVTCGPRLNHADPR
jgi:hypothetical protein